MATAMSDSVTVSIAALMSGMLRDIPRVTLVRTSTSRGRTEDLAGISRTSSYVRASPVILEREGGTVIPSEM
jgi:hypothetical protein